jgi:uncharacterized caspase-like protein
MKEYWQMLRVISIAILILASSLWGAHADGGRVALVVGVSKYEHAPSLTNTLNDAKDITAALKRLGFEVETVFDPSRSALEAAVRRYGDRSAGAEASVFYYSGHALEAGGRNWLVPATANLNTERDLRFETVDLNTILEQTDGAAKVAIVFLDACRDNPFARRLSATQRGAASRGLARVDTTTGGMLVAFSTAPGQVALDGVKKNSPFTAALLSHIETVGLEIKSLLARVTKDVVAETKGKQRPWQNSSMEGDFYFLPPPASADAPSAPAAPSAVNLDGLFWDSIKASRNPADFKAYLAKFPSGVFAELARNRLAVLDPETASKPPTASAAQAVPPSTAPPSQQAAIPAPTANSSLQGRLLARLTALSVPPELAENIARSYETDKDHKAIAVGLKAHRTWREGQWGTDDTAVVATLEKCQVYYGEPCALAAVGDKIEQASGGPPVPRDMARARYDGLFEPEQIPGAGSALKQRADVVAYRSGTGTKAAAYHPMARLFIVRGLSQFEAEELALKQCNDDPDRKGRNGPCFLYAVGDQVVLPQRSIKPISQRRSDPPQLQQGAIQPHGPNSFHDQLKSRLAGLAVAAGEADNIRKYETGRAPKALAVSPKGHFTYWVGEAPTDSEATAWALEGCQVWNGEPCTLAAINEKVEGAPDRSPVVRDMPRPRYAGRFEPERIPAADATLLRRTDVTSYRSITGPKAAAFYQWGSARLFIVTGAAGQFEAEEQALTQCNNDRVRIGWDGACFLYAAGDRVVLPQRLTKPRPRPQTISEAFDYLGVPRHSYDNQKAHKAIAFALESGQTFAWGSQSSAAIAEQKALEGCQLSYRTACVLLASGDELRAPDPWKAARRDMPRLHHEGKYRPESVPLFSGTESELQSYVSLRAPKAMVIRPSRGRVRTAAGATAEEAQSKALAACNDDSDPLPCFVYAVNDAVIIGQRRTEPQK